MPLSAAQLASTLEDVFNGVIPAVNAAEAGDNWAAAIDEFAQGGAANGVPASVSGAAVSGLATALGNQFAIVPGSAAGAASGIVAALDAFWATVVFAGMTGPPVPTGSVALVSDLTSIFSTMHEAGDAPAIAIADAVLAYTNLVIVTFPPGNPFPVV